MEKKSKMSNLGKFITRILPNFGGEKMPRSVLPEPGKTTKPVIPKFGKSSMHESFEKAVRQAFFKPGKTNMQACAGRRARKA
ncbi:hypothetical protein SAMN05444405_11152 [Bacteroides luti]|uniref:Uncharacterized protein n=2 Tax=Bacteroides luti TaxID=1297750 RepID=A0A1M5D4L8_9BACE|nr:hypothetical protein SAMN05444405_11152 [Bacteroides luti]